MSARLRSATLLKWVNVTNSGPQEIHCWLSYACVSDTQKRFNTTEWSTRSVVKLSRVQIAWKLHIEMYGTRSSFSLPPANGYCLWFSTYQSEDNYLVWVMKFTLLDQETQMTESSPDNKHTCQIVWWNHDTHMKCKITEWVRLEGTTVVWSSGSTSLLKQAHPRAHGREWHPDSSWVSPMRETPQLLWLICSCAQSTAQ